MQELTPHHTHTPAPSSICCTLFRFSLPHGYLMQDAGSHTIPTPTPLHPLRYAAPLFGSLSPHGYLMQDAGSHTIPTPTPLHPLRYAAPLCTSSAYCTPLHPIGAAGGSPVWRRSRVEVWGCFRQTEGATLCEFQRVRVFGSVGCQTVVGSREAGNRPKMPKKAG